MQNTGGQLPEAPEALLAVISFWGEELHPRTLIWLRSGSSLAASYVEKWTVPCWVPLPTGCSLCHLQATSDTVT